MTQNIIKICDSDSPNLQNLKYYFRLVQAWELFFPIRIMYKDEKREKKNLK